MRRADRAWAPDQGEADERVALEAIYRRHAGWLKASLKRRFGAALGHLADDFVQEAYLRAARAGEPIRHPRAFLLQVATRIAYDHLRGAARTDLETGRDAAESGADPVQLEAVLLKQIVLGLPAPCREVFLLSRFGGLTYPEIADRLGISVKTVEWRMSRALALCVSRLSG